MSLTATPSEIEEDVGSVVPVVVRVDNPVPGQTYSLVIDDQPVSGMIEDVEDDLEAGTISFTFTATTPIEFGMVDSIGVSVTDSEGNEGNLDIPVTVNEEQVVQPPTLQSR